VQKSGRNLDHARDRRLSGTLAPIAAIGVGAVVAARHGVSPSAFLPNAVAVAIGMLLVYLAHGPARDAHVPDEPGLAAESPRPRVSAPVLVPVPVLVLVGAALAIALTLACRGAGLEGVHRWLPLGPLRLIPWNLALGVGFVASFLGLFVALAVPPRGDAPTPGSASVRAAAALALFASIAVSFFGAFPVPVAGAGAAPVLGFYGLLAMVGAAGAPRKRAPVEHEPRAHR
jgi:hypothetical protein